MKQAQFVCKPGNVKMLSSSDFYLAPYEVKETLTLSNDEWESFQQHPLHDREWLGAFSERANINGWYTSDKWPCLLVRSHNEKDRAILVDTQGYSYARYAALLPRE